MRIQCVVDNTVGHSSRLWGEHGLALLVDSPGGRILFDSGAGGAVLLHNLQALRIDPASLSAVALSHAHQDHTGGLRAALELRPGLPLYGNADLLRERFKRQNGRLRSIGLPMAPSELDLLAEVRLGDGPQEILPGVWTTGEVTPRPHPEGAGPDLLVRHGEGWAPDRYRDDMALTLEGREGLVLVCGCCHAGLLNTLEHVRHTFGKEPVAVVGGSHLVSADAVHLDDLIRELGRAGGPALYLNHCTGLPAHLALAQAFGDRVHGFPAGAALEL